MLLTIFVYLGPGLGGGILAMIAAFLISLLTFIIAILWYPLKKVIQRIKKWRSQ